MNSRRTVSIAVVVLLAALPVVAGNKADIVNPAEPLVSNPSHPSSWSWPRALLYDNGPLVTTPGGGAGGADISELQTALGMNTNGFGNQFPLGYRVADDFTVTNPGGWQIDTITFFGYQTGSTTTSTFTGVYVQIWNGAPDAGGVVVWGDLTTNRMASTDWSNIYRVSDATPADTNRPIMNIVGTIGTTLAAGTYWVDWTADGTGASGPWAPPISILGQTTTGNAKQFTAAWADIQDGATFTPQGLPFIINGTAVPVELQAFDVE